jgi:hypothetical protein
MNEKPNDDYKVYLVVASLLSGIAMFCVVAVTYGEDGRGMRFTIDPQGHVGAVLLGIATAFLYPFVAAFVVSICSYYRSWAMVDEVEPWKSSEKIGLGAIWPLVLIWSLIVYSFCAIINRVFPQD